MSKRVAVLYGGISAEREVSLASGAQCVEALKEAGYAVNRHARSLRLKRSKVMLVLIPNLANPNFPDLLMHIDRAAYDCGYDIMIAHTAIDPHRSDRYVDELLAGGLDGVLLTAD